MALFVFGMAQMRFEVGNFIADLDFTAESGGREKPGFSKKAGLLNDVDASLQCCRTRLKQSPFMTHLLQFVQTGLGIPVAGVERQQLAQHRCR